MMLSVIIPAYNEADGISAIIERVLAIKPALASAGVDELELIVVDDGSTDLTFEIASKEDVCVIRHKHNRGYGRALKTGFNAARGELLGFLDADGTYPPEQFPKLCEGVLLGGELVVGSRRSGAESQMPVVRKVGNFLWSNLITALTGQRVTDPATGMRVFRKKTLVQLYPLPDGLNFTPVMSTRAINEQIKLLEIPIPYSERVGRSKLGVVSDGFLFLNSIILTAMSYNPSRVLGRLGTLLVGLSAVLALALMALLISDVPIGQTVSAAGAVSAIILTAAGIELSLFGVFFRQVVSSIQHCKGVSEVLDDPETPSGECDRFWWLGIAIGLTGLVICGVSLVLNAQGWPLHQLWLCLLVGTMLVLLGLQLIVLYVIALVTHQLTQREALRLADLNADER